MKNPDHAQNTGLGRVKLCLRDRGLRQAGATSNQQPTLIVPDNKPRTTPTSFDAAVEIYLHEPQRRGLPGNKDAITSALLWVRLPHLSVELWGEAALQRLLEDASEYVMANPFIVERKCLGYARVCIKSDLSHPLIPGVRVEGPTDVFWQRFTFENLGSLCSACGSLLHLGGSECGRVPPVSKEATEAAADAVEPGTKLSPIRRGSWMVTVRRWSLDQERPPMTGKSSNAIFSNAFPPPVSIKGWQNPTHTNRRCMVSPGSSSIPLSSWGRSEGKASISAGGLGLHPWADPEPV